MSKIIIFSFTILLILRVNAQQDNQILTVIASGDGENQSKATNAALRNSIEKTLGVFISSNTEVNNDILLKDQINTIASGNVLEYNIISVTNVNNNFNVTVSAKISLQKLVSLINNKSNIVHLNGGVFGQNVKIENYYREQESIILSNFFTKFNQINLFDIDFIVQEPKPIRLLKEPKPNFTINDSIKFNFTNNYHNLFRNRDFKTDKKQIKSILKTKNLFFLSEEVVPINEPSDKENSFFIDIVIVPKFNENYIKFIDEFSELLSIISIPLNNDNNSKVETPKIVSLRMVPNNLLIDRFFVKKKYEGSDEYKFYLRSIESLNLIKNFFRVKLVSQFAGCGFFKDNALIKFNFCNYLASTQDGHRIGFNYFGGNHPSYGRCTIIEDETGYGSDSQQPIVISPFVFSCYNQFRLVKPIVIRIFKSISEIEKLEKIEFESIR
jgi:hypothetical protein